MSELGLIRWEAPGPYVVAFSTRRGGVSEPPFDTLNLGGRVGDDPARVEENWRRLAAQTGLGFARVRQVHGARAVHLDAPCPSPAYTRGCRVRLTATGRPVDTRSAGRQRRPGKVTAPAKKSSRAVPNDQQSRFPVK